MWTHQRQYESERNMSTKNEATYAATWSDFYAASFPQQREAFTSLALEPATLFLPAIVEVNELTQARGETVPISSLDEIALVELDMAIAAFVATVMAEVRETLISIRARQLELAPPLDLFSSVNV